MKKTTFLLLALFFVSAFSTAFAKKLGDSTSSPPSIKTIIINADVTVVLIDNENAAVEVAGNGWLNHHVKLAKNTDTLVIDQTGNDDLKSEGVIYVSASNLQQIQVNGQANLRSLNLLQMPVLEVAVNNDCTISLHHAGTLTVSGKYAYVAERSVQKVRWPSSVLKRKQV